MNSSYDMTILFGSQTGNAEDVACRIAREAKRHHKVAVVAGLDEYSISKLVDEKFVVFVVSTTGQGDPPDNMRNFWKFIWRRALPTDCLSQLQFAVLGLGDSSYQKFNMVAKKLNKRLVQLGGSELLSCCHGDEQHELGYNAAVNPWLERFWAEYLQKYPMDKGMYVLPSNQLLPPRFNVRVLETPSGRTSLSHHMGHLILNTVNKGSVGKPFKAPVLSNKRVTSESHWQDVRLITFNISGSGISYDPGDVCWVRPRNSRESVSEFMTLMNLDPNTEFRWECIDQSSNLRLPQPCTIGWLAEEYLDINGLPKQYFWEVLAALAAGEDGYTDDGSKTSSNNTGKDEETEKDGGFLQNGTPPADNGGDDDDADLQLERGKLTEFLTAEGQDELFSYCYRPRRTILEILADFPHTRKRLKLARLLDIIHPIRPRVFSIASSQLIAEDKLQLLVAVVTYKTKLLKPRKGVCSNYLASLLPVKDAVELWVEHGTMKFPLTGEPCIMVGPGTGCAPFRSFIDQRSFQGLKENFLFFGCRSSGGDFFFNDEWREKERQKSLKLFTAFSRDQAEKVYVQHVIAENRSLLKDLLFKKKAYFFLAGNSKNMPESVRKVLMEILAEEEGTDESADQKLAEGYLLEMERTGRYQSETWS